MLWIDGHAMCFIHPGSPNGDRDHTKQEDPASIFYFRSLLRIKWHKCIQKFKKKLNKSLEWTKQNPWVFQKIAICQNHATSFIHRLSVLELPTCHDRPYHLVTIPLSGLSYLLVQENKHTLPAIIFSLRWWTSSKIMAA